MKSFEIQTKIHRRGWFSSTLNLKKPLISAYYNHILSWHGGCLSGFINGVNISIPEDAPHDPRRDYMNPFYNPTKTVSPNPSTTACSFAGATGGPGNTPPSDPSLSGNDKSHTACIDVFSPKKEQHNYDSEILEVMLGGSGGIGGIPTCVDEAKDKEMTPAMVIKLLHASVSKMSTEEKYKTLLELNSKTQPNIVKAQTYLATIALQHGVIANLIMKDVKKSDFNPKAWVNYRRENLDKYIHPNTLAGYMNVAKIDNVAAYLHLGIDRLGKLAVVIEKMGMIDDEDPIKAIISSVDNQTMANGVAHDFTEKCEAAILHHKFKKAGLDKFTMNDSLSILAEGRSIDKKDISKMVELKNNGIDYLKYIEKDCEYNNPSLIETSNISNKPKIKDVNAEIEKMRQTVSKAFAASPSMINLDLEKLDALITTLNAFRQTFAGSKETLKL